MSGSNKPIWQVAEEREENKHSAKDPQAYADYGGWHKAAKVCAHRDVHLILSPECRLIWVVRTLIQSRGPAGRQ